MAEDLPTPAELRKLLEYNPQTGALTWLRRPREMFKADQPWKTWNTRYAGGPAFTAVNSHGYRNGKIFDRLHKAHRVAYALHHGEWPANDIDHINGVRTDNRIDNLRAVTSQENNKNAKRRSDNTSGVVGVSWHKASQKWRADIAVDGKIIHLGYFDCFLAAGMVRRKAEADFNFHTNHGRASA